MAEEEKKRDTMVEQEFEAIEMMKAEGEEEKKDDPFAVVENAVESGPSWAELDNLARAKRVVTGVGKLIGLLTLLYVFICTLSFLSSGFRLLGGKAAGEVFSSGSIIGNPIAGLMIGMLVTVLVQSSSTSSSIIVAMVASKIIKVRPGIPIIMGANIGTSVTNTLVSMAQAHDRTQFRRAFAGATVHDMFNLLCVVTLLPLEIATGYLYYLTDYLVSGMDLKGGNKGANKEFLNAVTKPLVKMIIQIDETVIEGIAEGDASAQDKSLIRFWCDKGILTNVTINTTQIVHTQECAFLFHDTGMSDSAVGGILLVISLILLCTCLVLIVKLLNSMLQGHIANVLKKTINNDFKKPFGFLKGYLMILLGAGLTIIVQSSSVFTSTLTPLVGIGLVSVERIFPLTLGSNIGTTVTGILASLAVSPDRVEIALQIALCHLFFNISGILLWYPVPVMRALPIRMAKQLGCITADYRWFAPVYIIFAFFLLPAMVFALSLTGWTCFFVVFSLIVLLIIFILFVNIMQSKAPRYLPKPLRNWNWLPLWCRSLEPHDRVITKITKFTNRFRRQEKEDPTLVK